MNCYFCYFLLCPLYNRSERGTGKVDEGVSRVGLRRCGPQLGTISVGPGSQSTCTKVCRIRSGAQLRPIGPIGCKATTAYSLFKVGEP